MAGVPGICGRCAQLPIGAEREAGQADVKVNGVAMTQEEKQAYAALVDRRGGRHLSKQETELWLESHRINGQLNP